MKNNFVRTVIHNIDISFVMCVLDDTVDCVIDIVLHNLEFYQQNGVEVLLMCNNEKILKQKILPIIEQYPLINWVLLSCANKEADSIALINTAIKYASKKYIFISTSNLFFKNNIPYILGRLIYYYNNSYVVVEHENTKNPIGILCDVEKLKQINKIKSRVNSSFLTDLGYKLDRIGVRKLVCNDVKYKIQKSIIYRDSLTEIVDLNTQSTSNSVLEIYHWQNNKYKTKQFYSYLEGFEQFHIKDDALQNKYKKILLCQSYNESNMIVDFLNNMALYFDGIILLDDGSSDDTYIKAKHDKLILKFQKKRTDFNDLQNRNTLLDVASYFNSEWFCFMDIDERIDSRYVSIFDNIDKVDANNIAFIFVHLWNSPETYNPQMQDCTYEGMFRRWRMFRNMGRANLVTSSKKLHFPSIPITNSRIIAPVLIHHYGNLTKEQRENKFNFYKVEDKFKDQSSYDDLLEPIDLDKLYSVKEISHKKIKHYCSKFNIFEHDMTGQNIIEQ